MRKDDANRLRHMRDAAREALDFARNRARSELEGMGETQSLSIPPISRPSAVVCNRDDLDDIGFHPVYDAVWESAENNPAGVMLELWPAPGRCQNSLKRCAYFADKRTCGCDILSRVPRLRLEQLGFGCRM